MLTTTHSCICLRHGWICFNIICNTQAAVFAGVSSLLDNLTDSQNQLVRKIAALPPQQGESKAAQELLTWSRLNGASNVTKLDDINTVIKGWNNMVTIANVQAYQSYQAGDEGGVLFAWTLSYQARRRGATASFTAEGICDSLAGLEYLQTQYNRSISGAGSFLESAKVNITQQNSPLPRTIPGALRLGDQGAEVQQLQILLQWLGFLNGTADGIYGRATQDAVVNALLANNRPRTSFSSTTSPDDWTALWSIWYAGVAAFVVVAAAVFVCLCVSSCFCDCVLFLTGGLCLVPSTQQHCIVFQ